jgi:hypothetical protein
MSKNKEDEKLLNLALERYKRARAKDYDARKQRLDDLKFSVLLEQWPEAEKHKRENDPNGARPCLVIDKLNQYVHQVVNDMRQNRPAIKVRGVNDSADVEVAEVLQGVARHIEDQSRADIAYDWAGELAVRCGLGFFRIKTDYINQESFDQEICIDRIMDNDCVTMDDMSTDPAGADQKWCFVSETITKAEFEENYPKAEPIDFDTDKEQDWFGDNLVVIADYYYLEAQEKTIYALDDGSTMESEEYVAMASKAMLSGEPVPQVIRERKVKVNQCKIAKMNGKQILEKTEFPAIYIPVFPVIGSEGFVEGKRYLSGIIRPAKDSARLYNYVRSAFTEAVALAPKAPYIAADGQIDEFPEWDDANVTNYSVLRYKPVAIGGTIVGAPQRQPFAGVPAGLAQDMQIAEHDIQSTMGMYNASLGKDGNEKSGKAILARQKEGDTSTFHYPDNLARSIQHCGRVIIGMIPKVYDTTRVLRILGMDGTPDFAHVDPDQDEAVKEVVDDQGAVKKIYNLGVGTYDVTVTVGPSYNTKRMESAEAMTQILQGNQNLMPIIGDLYFKSLDMPYSDEISKRMKKMLPPALHEKEEGKPELPPEVQQQLQQQDGTIKQLDDTVKKMHDELESKDIERDKLGIENYKAQTERLKVEGELALKEQAQNATDLTAEFGEVKAMLIDIMRNSGHLDDQEQNEEPGEQSESQEQPPPMQQPMNEPQPPQDGGFFTPNGQG